MRHSLLTAAVVLLAFTPAVAAVDATGTILWIDAERCKSAGPLPARRCVLAMRAGGQNRQVRIEKDVRVLDGDGRPLPGGLASPELKAGAEITVTLEGGEHFVTVIRLGRAVSTYDRPSFGLTPLTEMTAAERRRPRPQALSVHGRTERLERLDEPREILCHDLPHAVFVHTEVHAPTNLRSHNGVAPEFRSKRASRH